MTRAGMIRTDQKPPNPLFKGEVRLDGGREDRLPAETTNKAEEIKTWISEFENVKPDK